MAVKAGFVFVFDESDFAVALLKGFIELLETDRQFHLWIICSSSWSAPFRNYFFKKKLHRRVHLISAEPQKIWVWLRDLSLVTDHELKLLKINRGKYNKKIENTLKILKKSFGPAALKISRNGLEGGDILFGEKMVPVKKRLFHLDLSLAIVKTASGQTMACLADQKSEKPSKFWNRNKNILVSAGIQKVIRIPCTHLENLKCPTFNLIQFGNSVLVPSYQKSSPRIAVHLKKAGLKVIRIPCDSLSPFRGAIRCRTMEVPKSYLDRRIR